jgi:tRNA/tmRNA/rRNA uracil-C5-methylase (TrmA/RlmC/RlmD family)
MATLKTSFSRYLPAVQGDTSGEGGVSAGAIAPFAFLEYDREISLKNDALRAFCADLGLRPPDPVVPSPLPRHYRTTSKRAVAVNKKNIVLGVIGEGGRVDCSNGVLTAAAMLEPEINRTVFESITAAFNGPAYRPLGNRCNYVVLRSAHDRICLIFNVRSMDATVVRKSRVLSERLRERCPPLVSAFLFCDPSRSVYYLDNSEYSGPSKTKKLWGHDTLKAEFCGSTFFHLPTAFSQVNHSMVPLMLERVAGGLPRRGRRLLDLYCGYGLFSIFLNRRYDSVIGIDSEKSAISSAIHNVAENRCDAHMKFLCGAINPRSLRKMLPPAFAGEEDIILDPPRQGTRPGVIDVLARRRPRVAVQVICNADRLPDELRQWQTCGYRPLRIVPLDMFPGTAELEVLVFLSRR